jgi:sulfatase maturation enzyme AslB (radical SAM superfamily)
MLYNFLHILAFLKDIRLLKITGLEKKYPRVIQLPITYRCNSKCVMCNIWKMDWSNELDLEGFKKVMRSPIFKKVISVGINGGEPSFVKQLPEYVETILQLPRLKSINIISHGFNQKQLFPKLKEIYTKCRNSKVLFHVSISLDGIGEIHNKIRGLNVFDISLSTITEIQKNKENYCDSFDIGCTVIKQNIDHLKELYIWAKTKEIPIKFRLGISNKRIESDKILKNFSVIDSVEMQTAKEFFYSMIGNEKGIYNKFRYFSIYYFLQNKPRRRLLGCMWKNSGITLDSRGNIYYCAVESKKIGNLMVDNGIKTFFSKENLNYRKGIIDNSCKNCIHDYTGNPELVNILPFIKETFYKNYFTDIYKILVKIF